MLASLVPVSIRFVLSASVASSKSNDYNLVGLIMEAKMRVNFLRDATLFVLSSSAKLAECRRAIRKAIHAPKTSALRVAADKAVADIAAINAKLQEISIYFLECPALSGQSIGVDADGNTVTGSDLANAIFGSVSAAQSKSLLRAVVNG